MSISDYVRLQSIKGLGPKKIMSILMKLKETGQGLDYIFASNTATLVKEFGLTKIVAEALVNSAAQPSIAEQMAQKGIRVLAYNANDYPQKIATALGTDAPPILYVWGNLDLLSIPGIGFCGSRDVTSKGIEVTQDSACQIAQKKWTVISGHARGVDTTAHQAALDCGSGTIVVIPQGILDFKLRQELKQLAKPNQLLIISEFFPTAHWTVGNAMTRNKTILGLSDAMILVESGLSGGTFEAGKAALKWNIPLYVVEYQARGKSSEGNTFFLQKGAIALRKNVKTGRANITSLAKSVNKKRKVGPKPHSPTKRKRDEEQLLLQPTLLQPV